MTQVQVEKPAPQETKEESVEEVKQSEDAKHTRDKLDDLDSLLDEIDGVLEENAQEFVTSYIQKGGQ